MKNRLRIWPVALVAALVAGSTSNTIGAQPNGRLAVAGRQQVRAALAAAMADGKLSEKEHQSILQQAKVLLAPNELRCLEQTLDQASTGNGASLPPAPREDAGEQHADPQRPDRITTTGLVVPEEAEPAKTAAYDSPNEADGSESPFREETPEEIDQLLDETTVVFADPQCTFEDLNSLYLDGRRYISLTTSVEAFKGPLDLDNLNGNFGFQFGINGAIPLARWLGVGIQAGTSAVLSDFHGTQFTGSTIRAQNFTTVGWYQRVPAGERRLKWGFAFDWLYDHYYSGLSMSQWRVKLAYELNPCSELGIWACIPNDGDNALLQNGQNPVYNRFKPVAQGNLYYRRRWQSGTSTTTWLGIAEEPGQFIFGADARVPISCRLAFVSNFNYVLPSASGVGGQDEEMWNVSIGIEFRPGRAGNYCSAGEFAPLFPLANNGTFAIRRY